MWWLRCPLGTIQPLNVPQPPPDLLLLELFLRQTLFLLLGLELHIATIFRFRIDGTRTRATRPATNSARDSTASCARSRFAILEAIHGDGEVSLVGDAPIGNVPLFGTEGPDEFLVVRNHNNPTFVIANSNC